mmetsp:Transcript_45640/g.103928  ORF Transcript_45640/g.103928 Transcript_45640/m.103928 type:complete len:207 (+) Transcript_45640:76-696(+)
MGADQSVVRRRCAEGMGGCCDSRGADKKDANLEPSAPWQEKQAGFATKPHGMGHSLSSQKNKSSYTAVGAVSKDSNASSVVRPRREAASPAGSRHSPRVSGKGSPPGSPATTQRVTPTEAALDSLQRAAKKKDTELSKRMDDFRKGYVMPVPSPDGTIDPREDWGKTVALQLTKNDKHIKQCVRCFGYNQVDAVDCHNCFASFKPP